MVFFACVSVSFRSSMLGAYVLVRIPTSSGKIGFENLRIRVPGRRLFIDLRWLLNFLSSNLLVSPPIPLRPLLVTSRFYFDVNGSN